MYLHYYNTKYFNDKLVISCDTKHTQQNNNKGILNAYKCFLCFFSHLPRYVNQKLKRLYFTKVM